MSLVYYHDYAQCEQFLTLLFITDDKQCYMFLLCILAQTCIVQIVIDFTYECYISHCLCRNQYQSKSNVCCCSHKYYQKLIIELLISYALISFSYSMKTFMRKLHRSLSVVFISFRFGMMNVYHVK